MSRRPGEREAALNRLRKGQSTRTVAKALGVPKSTVADWRRLAGLDGAPSGVMVAFFLPNDAARQLALDPEQVPGDVETPEELHLTLAYLGEDSGGIKDVGRLRRVVAGFAAMAPTVEGEVSGLGRFANGEKVVYASFDSPALPEWRQRLVQHLRAAGFPPDASHGFTPHVTLAKPDGAVALDVSPLALRFETLTLAVDAERWDYPLEGTGALFAERTPDQIATAQADNSVGLPIDVLPEPAPPIMDELALRAWHRYFYLLVNDVPHHRALEAVKKIDPDFDMSQDQARRAIHAIGKGEEPVKFSNWSAGSIKPPDYVQAVYQQFDYDAAQVADIESFLYEIATNAYLEGINAQLVRLGVPIATRIEDRGTLADIRSRTQQIADGIVSTFRRELGGEVYTAWVELSGEKGTQMSRYWLEQAVTAWLAPRTEYKAGQVAATEVNRFWNLGGQDFVQRNSESGMLKVWRAWVSPDECVCLACQRLVDGNPYAPDEAAMLGLPLHPTCAHDVTWDAELMADATAADLWSGQADVEEVA